jgi:hypothetical protein
MTREYTSYLAEKFLREYQTFPVEKRLAFDAWADRQGFGPETKRRLWREVKVLSRNRPAKAA